MQVLMLASLGALGLLRVFGIVDDRADIEDADGSLDPAVFRRAVVLAFLISAVAAATFIAASALVDHLDRVVGAAGP